MIWAGVMQKRRGEGGEGGGEGGGGGGGGGEGFLDPDHLVHRGLSFDNKF